MIKAVFFYYKDKMKTVKWEKLGDLKPYKIGGALGYFYEPTFKKAGLDVEYSRTVELSICKLRAGCVDLVPETELVCWHVIKNEFPNEVKNFGMLPKPLAVGETAVMVSRMYPNSTGLIAKFNKGLEQIKEKGVYRQILMKYGIKISDEEVF